MPKKQIDLSIVIVNYNTKDITVECLNSIIANTSGINYEIIVIDNASVDGSIQAIKKINEVKLILNSQNKGFAHGNNQGIKVANGKFVLFLNTDTLINDNVLDEMIKWMDVNPNAGVATPALKNKDGSLQGTGGYFPTLPRVFSWMTIQDLPFVDNFIKPFHPYHSKSFFSKGASFYDSQKELDWVTGAYLMTRRDILEKIEGWDESFFMYVEEVDLCYRIKQLGYKIWYLPKWSIIHFGGASSKTNEFSLISEYQGIKKFYKKLFSSWQYQVLRLLLKIGALGRMVVFGILEGRESVKIYAKAYRAI